MSTAAGSGLVVLTAANVEPPPSSALLLFMMLPSATLYSYDGSCLYSSVNYSTRDFCMSDALLDVFFFLEL
jgi:hypothetical protein